MQRIEEDSSWLGEEPLWIVTPHLPDWLKALYEPERVAPGCYWVAPRGFVWIAANELPAPAQLAPMTRSCSSRKLFRDWPDKLPMSTLAREELLWRFGKADDPEVESRRQHILKVLLEASPQTQQELIDQGRQEGRLAEARTSLRRVLTHRQLTPNKDEGARIDACADLAILERWNEQAFSATSISDALK